MEASLEQLPDADGAPLEFVVTLSTQGFLRFDVSWESAPPQWLASGRLYVQLLSGSNLPSADRNGKSDPYVKMFLGGQERKSKTIKATLDPVWGPNEVHEFDGRLRDLASEPLLLRCYDYDFGKRDDKLGHATVDLRALRQMCAEPLAMRRDWHMEFERIQLYTYDKPPKPTAGSLHVRVRWSPSAGSALPTHQLPSAQEAFGYGRPGGAAAAAAAASSSGGGGYGGGGYGGGGGVGIGVGGAGASPTSLPAAASSPPRPYSYAPQQPGVKMGAPSFFDRLRDAAWRPPPQPPTLGTWGILRVELREGINLKPADLSGKSDPYVKMRLADQSVKSAHKVQELSPKWNEVFTFEGRLGELTAPPGLELRVFDRDLLSADDKLGRSAAPGRRVGVDD